MNITVRVGGIISNSLSEKAFTDIAAQLFGEDHTLAQYIKLFNGHPRAKEKMIVVHKEVPDDVGKLKAQREAERIAAEEAEFERTAGDYFDDDIEEDALEV